jgi:biotin operon repressor
MEFRHLQIFFAIVKEGSFLKAAEKLQYAQSTITLHIQQLEAELGVKLFSRRGKHTELTISNRMLLERAALLLHHAASLQQTESRIFMLLYQKCGMAIALFNHNYRIIKLTKCPRQKLPSATIARAKDI